MKPERHIIFYLAARIVAAALNLAAVALFTRMAGAAGYGTYLFVLAWGFIVHGTLSRWVADAFFARYRKERAGAYLSTTLMLTLAGYGAIAVVMAMIGAAGILEPVLATGVVVMAIGLAAYELALEVTRTRLDARQWATTVLLKAALVIAFGALAVLVAGSALALPFGIGIAYFCSALPAIATYLPDIRLKLDGPVARDLFRYGWPLILAASVGALAQNVDRLILAHLSGTGSLGPYGATADLLKQSFFVVGEAVAFALVSQAKSAFVAGDMAGARRKLSEAFRSVIALVVFGALLFLEMRDLIVLVLLGPDFREAARELIPILLAASAFLVLRTCYFGQVIYFMETSRLQVTISLIQLAVTAGLAFLLVPAWHAVGAAAAVVAGQLLACGLFVVLGRRSFAMPVPLGDVAVIAAAGALLGVVHYFVTSQIDGLVLRALADLALLVPVAGWVLLRYDLFASRDMLAIMARRQS